MKMMWIIFFFWEIAKGVSLNSDCSGGEIYCGSNATREKLQCENGKCKEAYLNNLCTISSSCAEGLFCNNGVCDKCSAACAECDSATVCTLCQQGYYLNTDKACSYYFGSCLKAVDGVCLSCDKGFLLTYGTCAPCPKGCSVCTTEDSCSVCSAGKYWNTTNDACQDGPEHCILAVNSTYCSECQQPYYTYTNKNTIGLQICLEGVDHCLNVLYSGSCKVCEDGYFLNGSTCQSHTITNCNVTSGENQCDQCQNGYYLHKTCMAAIPNCVTAAYSGCSVCNSGYFLNSLLACESCYSSTKCKTCSGILTSNCTVCKSGYYYKSSGASTCSACATNCISCTLAGPGKCDTCEDGYYLTASLICSACAVANAKKCDSTLICADGFRVSSGTCVACGTDCKHCTSITCTECLYDYIK